MKILVSSRSESSLDTLRQRVGRCGRYQVEGVLMVNGNMDPLRAIDYRPDVLVLHASAHLVDELRALAERPGRDRPALVVVGDSLSPEATRHAMRAGARDFVGEQDAQELAECLQRLRPEIAPADADLGQTVVVVNAKGGSGATFIATSLAHLSATQSADETVVVDLDFQYGSLPQYLDVAPKRGLLEALESACELDETAVTAYAAKHASGLHVIAPLPESQVAADFNIAERMSVLLGVLRRRYRRVVVDVPRHLDEVAYQVLKGADQVLLVMQQSLLAVHDAVRLKTVLVRELGIPEARIVTVVNRHNRSAPLDVGDISKALDDDDPVLIPNQYKVVSQSIDVGVSVLEHAPGSAVAKALLGLEARVMGRRVPESRGFLAKTVFRLRG
jgi:pilus assembly protein CpaE